jgi:hypothetical protein
VVQREVADPALHVGTWQRDGGLDPASPAGRDQARAWLEWMDRTGVEAVGFGLLTLRRTDAAPTVVFEDVREPFDDPLGPEVEGWLDRVDWLRAHADDTALLSARLTLAPSVLLERWSAPGPEGWTAVGRRGGPPGRAAVAARGGRPGRGPVGGLPRGVAARRARGAARHRARPADGRARDSDAARGARVRAARPAGARGRGRVAVRAVAARVAEASVRVDGAVVGAITGPGLLVLLGVHRDDTAAAAPVMARKLHELRILDGERSCAELGAPLLVVSQFTLYGDTRKGRRPTWQAAAPPAVAETPGGRGRRRPAGPRGDGRDGRVRRPDGRRVGERRAVHRARGGMRAET